VARITRNYLKTDKFALEVEHTVTFFDEHRQELMRYGAIALAVVLLVIGYSVYAGHQHTARQEALTKALQVQQAPVGPPATPGALSFPTQQAKDQEVMKQFSGVASKYPGSTEGEIAQYFLGTILADQGRLAEAEKRFHDVASQGGAQYSSLAKLSLAQIYFSDGRGQEGEKVLRDLMDHPTAFVSKAQATVTLARYLMNSKPQDARNLLKPLSQQPDETGRVALDLLGQIPGQ